MSKIVLTIEQPDDNLPLLDAKFLASLMHGMTRREPQFMAWTLTVDGVVFDAHDPEMRV